jgi:hypothetical protein
VSTPGNHPSLHDDQEGPDLAPPGEGFELYRHKNAEKMRTKNWHGYYWARRTEEGDYEIRSVPSMLGEHSVQGGVSCPRRAPRNTTRRSVRSLALVLI